MSRVLVTGATGFLGRRLGPALTAAGHEVVGTSRGGALPPGYTEVLEVSLGEPLPEHAPVDFVVHGAWDPEDSAACAAGTLAWAEALRGAGAGPQLFLSTITAAPDAASPYGREKLAAEGPFLAAGDAVLRLGLVIGPGGMFGRMLGVVRAAPAVPLLGGGHHRTWLTDPEAISAAILAWIEDPTALPRERAWALHDPSPVRLGELLRETARALGRRRLFLPVPVGLARAALRLTGLVGVHSFGGIGETNLRGLEQNHALALPSDVEALGLPRRPWRELVAEAAGARLGVPSPE